MRNRSALLLILALAACSGGGGGGPAAPVPNPSATPTPIPTSTPRPTATPTATPAPTTKLVRPAFTIRIPKRIHRVRGRQPQFVSSATLSVSIKLTSAQLNSNPSAIVGNPAVTNVNGTTGIPCTNGCTIFGPPSPPGVDVFTIVTYDAANAGGKALDTVPGSGATLTLTEGAANNESVTLDGIPAGVSIGPLPAYTAGSSASSPVGPLSAAIPVAVTDADGQTITGTYAAAVTLSDPDTNGDGTGLGTCPSSYPTGNPNSTATSLLFTSDTSAPGNLCYGGIAENPVVLTASASGTSIGSITLTPTLNTPLYVSGSATGAVVGTSPPAVELTAATGAGSTAGLSYSEAGWTEAPYDQQLSFNDPGTCSVAGPLSTFATISNAPDPSGTSTAYTITATASPTPGDCSLEIGEGLTSNPTDSPATLDVSYTMSSVGVNGRPRRKH